MPQHWVVVESRNTRAVIMFAKNVQCWRIEEVTVFDCSCAQQIQRQHYHTHLQCTSLLRAANLILLAPSARCIALERGGRQRQEVGWSCSSLVEGCSDGLKSYSQVKRHSCGDSLDCWMLLHMAFQVQKRWDDSWQCLHITLKHISKWRKGLQQWCHFFLWCPFAWEQPINPCEIWIRKLQKSYSVLHHNYSHKYQ